MARFVLIHGACHDGGCWQAVIPALQALGHAAVAPDLPGRGDDPRPHAALTLDDYARAVLAACDGPSVLVGHSAGGFAISRAANIAPDKVRRLVYLCAFLPRDGASLVGMTADWPRAPLKGIARRDGDSYAVDPALDDLRFYHDVPEPARTAAQAALVPEPMAPHAEAIRLGPNWQNTPRSYIRCTDDRTILPAQQVQMAADCDPKDRYDMPTGHSPYLSDPRGLAALLSLIAEGC